MILNKLTFPLVSLMTVLLFAFVSNIVEAAPPVFHTSATDTAPITTGAFTAYQGDDQAGIRLYPHDADGDKITLNIESKPDAIGELFISQDIVGVTILFLKNVPTNAPVEDDHMVTVQAKSDGESATLTVTVTVKARPRFDTSIDNNQVFIKGVEIDPITLPAATHDGMGTLPASSYALTPDLPAYLDFNAGTRMLRGTPDAVLPETRFTYTAKNPDLPDDRTKDGTLTFTITVVENNAPVFDDDGPTTRFVVENTPSGRNIKNPLTATDEDGDTLTYTLGDTADDSAFHIVSTSGQLQTRAPLDLETKAYYLLTVTVSDGKGGTDSITVDIVVTENIPPEFTEGSSTRRRVAENTATNTNIGDPITATDEDRGMLIYTLGDTADDSAFRIVSTSGQLQTRAPLDFETKAYYLLTVTVSDDNGGTASIPVDIVVTDVRENIPPEFRDGARATRSVAENTPSGSNIGIPITATDTDTGDTLTYTLGNTEDDSAFSIVSTSGQLQTKAALDYETKTSYAVTVSVSDGNGGSDSITVTINVTDVNETPPPAQPATPPSDEGTQEPTPPPAQPATPPSDEGTQEPTPPPAQPATPPSDEGTQEPTPVNHTVQPFDYEAEGVGKIVFSEWMLSRLNNAPQWIEVYNTTDKDIDLRDWQIVGRYMEGNDVHLLKSHTLKSLIVKAKETRVIAAHSASSGGGSYSKSLQDKVYLLGSSKRLWQGKAIVLELQDSKGNPIDRIGNLNEEDEVTWNIAYRTRGNVNKERRISLIRRLRSVESRQYNFRFGVSEFGWFPADEVDALTESKRSEHFYGHPTDVGAPGYRTEGADPLPVTLSVFIPEIAESGQVVLSWTTESEIENAGFNIFRGEGEQGPFVKVNATFIQGAGTTSERNMYQWTDTTAKTGVEYYYRIEDMSFDGISEVLATQRLKGVFTAKNRFLTNWGKVKGSDIP